MASAEAARRGSERSQREDSGTPTDSVVDVGDREAKEDADDEPYGACDDSRSMPAWAAGQARPAQALKRNPTSATCPSETGG